MSETPDLEKENRKILQLGVLQTWITRRESWFGLVWFGSFFLAGNGKGNQAGVFLRNLRNQD